MRENRRPGNEMELHIESDQRGMTLVEILVALAVSAIVLTGLGYMLVTSLQLYSRTNANVDAQNETQTALNLVLDGVLAAKGVYLIEEDAAQAATKAEADADYVTCALFGNLELESDGTSGTGAFGTFTGDAIFWQPSTQNMYLMSGTFSLADDIPKDAETSEKVVKAIEAMKNKALPATEEERLPYLMAQNITAFQIKTDDASFVTEESSASPEASPATSPADVKKYFKNPLILKVTMTVDIVYQNGKSVSREMSDSVSVRNRLNKVYIDRDGNGVVEYLRK